MKVGIIGCGQLARMMAHAAHARDIGTCFAAEAQEPTHCVTGLGPVTRIGSATTGEELFTAMGEPDVITVEREQVDTQLLRELASHCPVYPNPEAVEQSGNRVLERSLLIKLGLPVAAYVQIRTFADIVEALPAFSYPIFIKSCTQGYDGKAQWRLKQESDLPILEREFYDQSCVLEQGIKFTAEVSIIGVRSADGEIRFFPLTENHHHNGILLASFSPVNETLRRHEQTARNYLAAILEATNYVGVLCAELFVTEEGLVINEIAPRVHNSGHWTMDGCNSSQFDQHILAITGQTLAPVRTAPAAAMINVLGSETAIEGYSHGSAIRHSYNKSPRPGRKLGHINFAGQDRAAIRNAAEALLKTLYFPDNDERVARVVNQ